MKKSRIAKFALLGASAAALAATLSTSTYAWYVSNRQADVTGGYGATGTADSDGSIQVSWNQSTKKYSKSIAFTDANVKSNYTSAALQPVHYDTDGFYTLAVNPANKQTIKGVAAEDNDILTFEIAIKSNQLATQKTLVTPSIKITGYGAGSVASGTAVTPADQQVLVGSYKQATAFDSGATYYTRTGDAQSGYTYAAANPAPTAATFGSNTYYVAQTNGLPGKELNDLFTVDALKAMYVQQTVAFTTPDVSYVAADAVGVKQTSCTDTEPTGANAHTYYNAVTGNTVVWGNQPAASTGLNTFYITGTEEVVVKYVIFLDGGDVDCFNSCVGQNFSFELSFQGADPVDA